MPIRLLWIKTIFRAAFDYALYRDHRDLKLRKFALDAERWLFEPSHLVNSLEHVCSGLEIDIEKIRRFARQVTREQVKKLEFLERTGGKHASATLLKIVTPTNPKG